MNTNPIECANLLKCLGSYLLELEEGQQLLSTRELAETYNASTGSISAAIGELEEMGAVALSRRGWRGSFLEKKSIGILWKVIEDGPLVVALTLPSFPKCEGLATALMTSFESAGIEAYLIFIRGSYHRLKALRDKRCNAVVMSILAAEALSESGEMILLRLPPQSFVTDHRVFYRSGKENAPGTLRVGIDPDSFDIQYLTELEFAGQDVEFTQITFIQSDLHLERSPVDAAISNLDHLARMRSGAITTRPLSPRVQALIGDRDTSAAVVVRTEEKATQIVLNKVLKPELLMEIQQKVVDGSLVPRY